MKIVIDLYDTGLGNNGGSRTLVMCAETLAHLDHEVVLFSNIKSRYTWHKIDKKVKCIYGENSPSCDVIISTTPKSVEHTISSSAKRKFYYIRGYEVFWCSEKLVHEGYKKLPCIVNSEWLQRLLKKMGVESKIIYPGLDFGIFKNYGRERDDVIGGLFHKTLKTKKYKHIEKVADSLNRELWMLNREFSSPSRRDLTDFYNCIKVWMAPTELEGLHNPPMEASLCGCGLVATDHKKNGMHDYAIHNKTALVYPARDLEKAAEYVELLMRDDGLRKKLNDEMVKLLTNKVGTRKDNMKKLLEIIG